MARFYFDIVERDALIADDEGLELPDAAAAHRAAINGARDLLCAAICEGRLPLNDAIVVRDEATSRIDRVAYVDAVRVE